RPIPAVIVPCRGDCLHGPLAPLTRVGDVRGFPPAIAAPPLDRREDTANHGPASAVRSFTRPVSQFRPPGPPPDTTVCSMWRDGADHMVRPQRNLSDLSRSG